jgi:hypothetical protein
MNINEWLQSAKKILDKEELYHLEVHKAKIQLQLKNNTTGEIEIHEFDYTSPNAQNLVIK